MLLKKKTNEASEKKKKEGRKQGRNKRFGNQTQNIKRIRIKRPHRQEQTFILVIKTDNNKQLLQQQAATAKQNKRICYRYNNTQPNNKLD